MCVGYRPDVLPCCSNWGAAKVRLQEHSRRGRESRPALASKLNSKIWSVPRRHIDEAVAAVGADRVRVASGEDHLQRLGHHVAIGADPVQTDHVPAIGCAERVAPGLVHEIYGKLSASGDVETCCSAPLSVSMAYWITEKGLERTAA